MYIHTIRFTEIVRCADDDDDDYLRLPDGKYRVHK